MLRATLAKLRQLASYWIYTTSALPLSLDACRLKRRRFLARCRCGLQFHLEPRCGDSYTLYEVILRRDYFKHGIVVNPGDVVVDVGANYGAFAVAAAKLVGPGGKVVAIEPSPATYRRLTDNLALNQLQNVRPLQLAVSATPGYADLYEQPKSALTSLIRSVDGRDHIDGRHSTVEVTTIQQVIETHRLSRIDVLKLDCEGSEYDILCSLERSTAKCIKQIVMEPHTLVDRKPSELTVRLRYLGFHVLPTNPLVAFNQHWVTRGV